MTRPALPAPAWWSAVAVYTALLPGAITVWRGLVNAFGRTGAGYVPAVVLAAAAVFVVRRALARKVDARGWALLALAAGICAILLTTATLPSKRIHVPEYLLLAWLIDRALRASGGVAWQRVWVALLTATLGCVDEVLQGLVPGRYFSLLDALANAAAGAAGAMILAAASPLAAGPERPSGAVERGISMALFLAAATAIGVVQYLVAHEHNSLAAWPVYAAALASLGLAGLIAIWLSQGSAAQRALGVACAVVLILIGGGALTGMEFR